MIFYDCQNVYPLGLAVDPVDGLIRLDSTPLRESTEANNHLIKLSARVPSSEVSYLCIWAVAFQNVSTSVCLHGGSVYVYVSMYGCMYVCLSLYDACNFIVPLL